MKLNRSTTIATSSLLVTGSFVGNRGLQLLTQIYLARQLSPADFGVWGMVLIVTTLANLFKDKALASVLVQRGLDDRHLVNAVYSLTITISVGLFLLQGIAGWVLAQIFEIALLWPLVACAGLDFLISAGGGSHGAVLARRMQFQSLAIADVCGGIARFAVIVLTVSFGGGVWAFVAGELALSTVESLLKRWFSRYPFVYQLRPDPEAVRAIGSYIRGLASTNLAVYFNTNCDNFIIGKRLGTEPLGYYNLAYQLAMLPIFALSQINRVTFSVLSQRDSARQRSHICQLLQLYALVFAPLYGIGFVVAPTVIPLVYGDRWQQAVPLFQIIVLFAYARGFMAILGTGLNALDKPNLNAAINWVLVPLSISAFWIGAVTLGVTGVAIAVACVLGIVASLWFWIAVSRVSGWPLSVLVQPILLPTFAALLAVGLVTQIPTTYAWGMVIQVLGILLIDGLVVAVGSGGQIPRQILNWMRQSTRRAKA